MKFVLEENPIPKARHRSHIVCGHVVTYDPQKSEKMQAKFNIANQMRNAGFELIQDGPLDVSIDNFVKIPNSWSQKKKDALEGSPCISKPDLDNYAKFYFDVLNGIAYHDDRQITKCRLEKMYSCMPRVEITINLVNHGN